MPHGRGLTWEERRVVKAEWGTKRNCLHCEAHFYDLQRNPIRCPRCNSRCIASEESFRAQRHRKIVKPMTATREDLDLDTNLPVRRNAVTLPHGDEEEVLRDDDAKGNTLMEDASDFGADDDDMAEVMERLGA